MKIEILKSTAKFTLVGASFASLMTSTLASKADAQRQGYYARQQQVQPAYVPQTQYFNQAQSTQTNQPPTPQQVNIDGFPNAAKPLTPGQVRLKEFRDQPAQDMPIVITQPEWTPAIEAQYSQFVARFGRGVKASPNRTVKSYMRDSNVNMYANTDPAGVVYYSDCADFPYFLRSYFAFKNGLPMSIAADLSMNTAPYASLPDRDKDLTNPLDSSPYGNRIARRAASNIPSAPGRERNYLKYWEVLMDEGSTRTFRVGPLTPNYDLSDVYPVTVDPSSIHAGTVVHSNGHILVVTEVLADGQVNAIDAHPDNSVQFKPIDSSTLERSRPDHGFGFFNFRPTKAVGGTWYRLPSGQSALYGAQIMRATDAELYRQGKWSMQQWFGPNTNVAPQSHVDPNAWKHAYNDVGFFDFVRTQLSGASVIQTADDAAGALLTAMCDNLRQRVPDVQAAIDAGLTRQPRPATLPQNIYSADPSWELYATPSRDGRSRDAAASLPQQIMQKFKLGVRHQLKLTYAGSAAQFQQQIVDRVASLDLSCKAVYKKSDGSNQTMNFSDMLRRTVRMSFDMSDCPEKRWGAQGSELQACRDQDLSNAWYVAEQAMRNTLGKTDASENFVLRSTQPITLQMLQSGSYVDQPGTSPTNLGWSRSPIVDLKAYVASAKFLQALSQ